MHRGEAGAGDADGDFDGGPDEGADVGPGDVGLVDVEDGPDADDGGTADAGSGEERVSFGCGWGFTLWGIKGSGRLGRGWGVWKTYKAPTRKMAVKVTFCRIVRLRLHTGAIGSTRMTTSRKTFVMAVPRSEALLLMHLLWGYGRIQAASTGMHWKMLEKTMAIHQHVTRVRTT